MRKGPMMISVLAESNFDGMLLATLLAEEQHRDNIEVRVVRNLTAGYSVPRTMLAVERKPVAVVINAQSPEPEAASERKRRAEEVIGDVAAGVPFRVIVAVPELEILFFRRLDLLRRVLTGVDDHLIELAELSPRRAIAKLTPGEPYEQARFRILRAMDDDDVKALRETDLIKDLLDFIRMTVDGSKRLTASAV
jgi:hypothetical protein